MELMVAVSLLAAKPLLYRNSCWKQMNMSVEATKLFQGAFSDARLNNKINLMSNVTLSSFYLQHKSSLGEMENIY